VLKVERLNSGDVTRLQLRDIPDMDALYFTQLNSNKESLAVNTKTPEGKQIMEQLIRKRTYWWKTSPLVQWTGWVSPGSTFRNSTPGSSTVRSRASMTSRRILTLRFTRTWRNALAALTDQEENQIVTFLKTLTDGYTTPYPDINTYTGSCMTGGQRFNARELDNNFRHCA
jgi:hypothetical protein